MSLNELPYEILCWLGENCPLVEWSAEDRLDCDAVVVSGKITINEIEFVVSDSISYRQMELCRFQISDLLEVLFREACRRMAISIMEWRPSSERPLPVPWEYFVEQPPLL